MRIILKDERTVCQHPRRLAFTRKTKVKNKQQIEEWLNEALYVRVLRIYKSIVMVKKERDEDLRECTLTTEIESEACEDKFPLPIIECLEHFARSKGIFYIRIYAMVSFTSMLTKIAESIHPVSSQMDNLNSTKFLSD
ncbi:hypothetical protein TNCV_1640381 [Trichonephila clavipes]|nr:hypothetical protein TNCV_1640381 [Trichonephila clavipes]